MSHGHDHAPVLRVHPLRPDASMPYYASEGAAGLDLAAALDAPMTLTAGTFASVPTGLAVELPPGHEGQVRPRSGLAARHGVTVLNAPGTVDEDYRGEVRVLLINLGKDDYEVQPGERLAQLVVAPVTRVHVQVVEEPRELRPTARGEGGFGSTGGFGGPR